MNVTELQAVATEVAHALLSENVDVGLRRDPVHVLTVAVHASAAMELPQLDGLPDDESRALMELAVTILGARLNAMLAQELAEWVRDKG